MQLSYIQHNPTNVLIQDSCVFPSYKCFLAFYTTAFYTTAFYTIRTDHAPLQWLSAQKMEGLLCHWSLAWQEYDFHIEYRKGCQNSNADALSRVLHPITVMFSAVGAWVDKDELHLAQK